MANWGKKCDEQIALNPGIEWEELLKICGEWKWPGFLYYQGEGDDYKPGMYQKLLTRLIYQWREDWEEPTLPFLIVQLPMFQGKNDPDSKSWCLIREAQMNTYQTVKNTGIAVILECGEFNEIHPKDKTPVGERLALQALFQVYHKVNEKDAFGPIYKAHQFKDSGIEISFDYADEGFDLKGEARGFEIAGEDKNYVNASIDIWGSKIFLSSSEIDKPMYARYCWTNYGEVTIFGRNGIPLAPFRTSNKA